MEINQDELKKTYLDTMQDLNTKADISFWASLKTKLGLTNWKLGFLPTIGVLMFILKFIGILPLSWVVVLAPFYIPLVLVLYKQYVKDNK